TIFAVSLFWFSVCSEDVVLPPSSSCPSSAIPSALPYCSKPSPTRLFTTSPLTVTLSSCSLSILAFTTSDRISLILPTLVLISDCEGELDLIVLTKSVIVLLSSSATLEFLSLISFVSFTVMCSVKWSACSLALVALETTCSADNFNSIFVISTPARKDALSSPEKV